MLRGAVIITATEGSVEPAGKQAIATQIRLVFRGALDMWAGRREGLI